jgi:hypothetical protein
MRPRLSLFLPALLLGACVLFAEEPVFLPPAKVAQLKRMEPLNYEKLEVFLQAGQLSRAQVDLARRFIGADGTLNLPAQYVVEQPAAPPAIQTAAPAPGPGNVPRTAGGSLDTIGYLRQDDQLNAPGLSDAERRRLEDNLKAFRNLGLTDREAILRDLQSIGAPANPLAAAVYNDSADLGLKLTLWRYLANAQNPRAAGYIAQTHQRALGFANPVLIPYEKDIGDILVRGRSGQGNVLYSSRQLREMILELEKDISHCVGVRAATYLMDYYARRYGGDEAPMRDTSRDRDRLIRACGGDPKDFDDGDPRKWGCALPPLERALIAERLVPHLASRQDDIREIAQYSLLVVNGQPNKKLKDCFKDAHKRWPEFLSWWAQRREEMLRGQ